MLSGLLGKTSVFEQSVAVFGESGSGKTTLLSVFYGHQQSADFKKRAGYSLLAQDTTQGQKLLQAYHQIEDDLLPPQSRFRQHQFTFSIRPHGLNSDAGHITWHDYPGEWWTETRTGEEGERKTDAFRDLLSSDLALFLVDGQQLREHPDRYIPRLFKSFRDELDRVGSAVTEAGKKLSSFPRVWLVCLSKADLFPDRDVEWFRKEVLKQACDEIKMLRDQIASLVTKPECVTLGEEFLLLSSAKFDPSTGKISDPKQTIGIDLLSPLAVTLPLRWAKAWTNAEKGAKGVAAVMAEGLRGATLAWMKWLPFVGRFFQLLDEQAQGGVAKLREIQKNAVEKGDSVEAALAGLQAHLSSPGVERVYASNARK